MFKKKNYLSPQILFSIYFNKNITIFYNNQYNSNIISLKILKNTNIPFNYITEFNKTFAIEIATLNIKNKINTNNVFYNYRWDYYINIINNNTNLKSYSNFFFNRIWLEREVSEFFPVYFKNLKDTRNLLLNYNENKFYLLKTISVQSNDELKTSWHKRKINKQLNKNIEI